MRRRIATTTATIIVSSINMSSNITFLLLNPHQGIQDSHIEQIRAYIADPASSRVSSSVSKFAFEFSRPQGHSRLDLAGRGYSSRPSHSPPMSGMGPGGSLTRGLDVNLSVMRLPSPPFSSGWGLCPPHNGSRGPWRIDVEIKPGSACRETGSRSV